MESMKIQEVLPTGNLVIPNKPNADGMASVYLRYYYQKRYFKRSTNVTVPVRLWDPIAQRLRPSAKDAVRKNNILYAIKTQVDERILSYEGKLNAHVFQRLVNNEPIDADSRAKAIDFYEYCRKINTMLYNRKEYSYSSWYNKDKDIDAFQTFMVHYLKVPQFKLADLNVTYFDQYIEYRFTVRKNKSREAINKTLVPLYVAIKYAVKQGILENKDVYEIVDNYLQLRETEYNPGNEADDSEEIRYLTTEEINKIKDIQPRMKNKRTREIIDIFLFSYYACGMRLSDLLTLEWKHIDFEKKVIRKMQVKTKKYPDVLIPISSQAMEILQRWKAMNRNPRFVFDLLPEDFDITDVKAIFMQRNAKDKTFNRSLLTVSMTLRLPNVATMHAARHSFAVMAINNGMNIYLLSKLLGHSSIKSTERTYAKFLREEVCDNVLSLIEEHL